MIGEDNSEFLDTVHELKSLIIECKELQRVETLEENLFTAYKMRCDIVFQKLIQSELTPTISEIAVSGLGLKVKEVKNPVLKFLMSLLNSKVAISFNAPFLTKHSRSDNLKKYVFWTEMKLKGLLFNLGEYKEE